MRENIVQFGNEYLSINKVFEFMRCGLLTGFYFFQARGGREAQKATLSLANFAFV